MSPFLSSHSSPTQHHPNIEYDYKVDKQPRRVIHPSFHPLIRCPSLSSAHPYKHIFLQRRKHKERVCKMYQSSLHFHLFNLGHPHDIIQSFFWKDERLGQVLHPSIHPSIRHCYWVHALTYTLIYTWAIITLFRSITMLFGIDNILQNIVSPT